MKTLVNRKSVLAFVIMFVCSMGMYAVSPKNYFHDTKEENGKIVSKTVFLNEDGQLNKQVKYEFAYNESGKVTEKKAYRWNEKSESWENSYVITYNYDSKTGNINTVYAMWNKKTNDYSLNLQKIVIPATSYEQIFS